MHPSFEVNINPSVKLILENKMCNYHYPDINNLKFTYWIYGAHFTLYIGPKIVKTKSMLDLHKINHLHSADYDYI